MIGAAESLSSPATTGKFLSPRPNLAERIAQRQRELRGQLQPTHWPLPAAESKECYALTVAGARLVFTEPRLLVDYVRRNRDLTAVCLDGCAWRTFASFWQNIRKGYAPMEAFERADLTGLGSRRSHEIAARAV